MKGEFDFPCKHHDDGDDDDDDDDDDDGDGDDDDDDDGDGDDDDNDDDDHWIGSLLMFQTTQSPTLWPRLHTHMEAPAPPPCSPPSKEYCR